MTNHSTPPGVVQFGPGTKLLVDSRLCVVETVLAGSLLVNVVGLPGGATLQKSVAWHEVCNPMSNRIAWADSLAYRRWNSFQHEVDRRVWSARLRLVTMLMTGYVHGHQEFALRGEPFLGTLDEPLVIRAGLMTDRLHNSTEDWVRETVSELVACDARTHSLRPIEDAIPSARTLMRWCHALKVEGVWALADKRRGRTGGKPADRDRRVHTVAYVNEVLAATREHSTLKSTTIADRVIERAKSDGALILARTGLMEIIQQALVSEGRTPAQKRNAEYNRTRADRSIRRPRYPGQVYAADATLADNYVVLHPGGKRFRPWVVLVVDVATGVVVSAFATGRYKQITMQMALYDACRPILIAPTGGGEERRVKGHPERITATDPAWQMLTAATMKPGAVPRTLRADNAQQNSARDMMLTMAALGIDFSPSRKGRSTDNAHAESTFSALSKFFQRTEGYTGSSAQDKGKAADKGPCLTLAEYNVELQEFVWLEHNMARATTRRGEPFNDLARLEHWDVMVADFGSLPVLTDANAIFSFLPRRRCTRTGKGIRLDNNFFDAPVLWLGNRVVDADREVTVAYDPRALDRIWVEEKGRGVFHEVPNVIQDAAAPLTREITKSILERARLRVARSAGERAAFVKASRSVLVESEMTERIIRDLADYHLASAAHAEAALLGADISQTPLSSVAQTPKVPLDPDRPFPSPRLRG